jgi:hypothetical protein
VEILVQITPKVDIADPGLYIGILTADGTRIAGLDLKDFATLVPIARGQTVRLGFVIEALPLLPGHYSLDVHLKDMSTETIESLREHPHFEVSESPVYKGRHLDRWFGAIGLRARAVDSRLNAEAVRPPSLPIPSDDESALIDL